MKGPSFFDAEVVAFAVNDVVEEVVVEEAKVAAAGAVVEETEMAAAEVAEALLTGRVAQEETEE